MTTPLPLATIDELPAATDVLVVGSGAGGGPTAALLAEAGFDVLVVEEGQLVRQGEVVPFSLEQMDRQYRAGGVTAALGRPSIAYTEGCCAGGGTEINSGLYRRPPEDVLWRWRHDHGLDDLDVDELYPICDEVEAELSVQTVPGPPTAPSERLRRGAAAARLAARRDPPLDGLLRRRRQHGPAPQHDRDLPPPSDVAAGARLPSGHRVDRLVIDRRPGGAVATAAVVTDRAGATRRIGFRARRGLRRGDPDAGPAAALGTRPALRRARSPSTRPSSWRPASPTTSTSPTTCPSTRSRSSPPTSPSAARRRARASSRWRSATTGRCSARRSRPGGRSPCTTRRSPARDAAGCVAVPGSARPARHLPPHPPRPGPARPRPRPPGAGDAGGRRHRGVPVVPRRPDRALAAATWPRSRARSRPRGRA